MPPVTNWARSLKSTQGVEMLPCLAHGNAEGCGVSERKPFFRFSCPKASHWADCCVVCGTFQNEWKASLSSCLRRVSNYLRWQRREYLPPQKNVVQRGSQCLLGGGERCKERRWGVMCAEFPLCWELHGPSLLLWMAQMVKTLHCVYFITIKRDPGIHF